MPLQALDVATLSELLDRHAEGADERDPAENEHPLAQKLRMILGNRDRHRLGDLAQVVDEILGEMSLFRAVDHSACEREDGERCRAE